MQPTKHYPLLSLSPTRPLPWSKQAGIPLWIVCLLGSTAQFLHRLFAHQASLRGLIFRLYLHRPLALLTSCPPQGCLLRKRQISRQYVLFFCLSQLSIVETCSLDHLQTLNDAPTPLDQLTCEMNCCRVPPTSRSLFSIEDPLPDPFSLSKLAPPHPIYRESHSPVRDFQPQAAVPDLPDQAIRPSSSIQRPDWRNTFLPVSNMRDDPFGSLACNYPFYGRTDGI